MNDLKLIEYLDIRVVTTKQIAEAYGTNRKQISQAFQKNKNRYTEKKHYFVISGEEKRSFINRLQITDGSLRAKELYLWTERGALLLAKSINTDTAWEAYERLVDFYFEKKQEATKAEVPEVRGLHLPERASIPAPRRPEWYIKSKERIFEICERKGVEPKRLYYYLIRKLGQTYDLATAREVYKHDRGCYPEYDIDIVGYFPELSKAADKLLERMEL